MEESNQDFANASPGPASLAPWSEVARTRPLASGSEPAFTSSANSALNARLAALLATAAHGNIQAFEDFYGATVRTANAIVLRIAGSNHAEDVLSESYFQAWRQAALFDAGRANALTWLLSICRSRALDRLRREKASHGGFQGTPEMPEHELASSLPGPDALLEYTQSCRCLHNAITELSGPERWVLGLAFYGELSQTEIASVTDYPLGTVKTLIRRAQQKLRKLMDTGQRGPTSPF